MRAVAGASENLIIEEDAKLTFQEKIAAALGSLTGTIHTQSISLFILSYYTDVMGINPAQATMLPAAMDYT